MAGPNLEIFKFGFYMFFPIYVMFKFGDPEWYESYVKPQPPRTHEGVQQELARMKAERLARAQISQSQLAQRAATATATSTELSGESVPQNTGSTAAPAAPAVPTTTSGWGWPASGGTSTSTSGTAERLV
ncbi:hypothetical protein I317_00570 [Kwoniella heveanensis CBS 569]|nr:hypothetical protein I317_00570 [Kwoniella heveanensis CBS 569]